MYRDSGSNESNEWFAFRVRPRHEKQVSIALREKGFREFLPLYKSKRQWADRTSGVIDVVRAATNPLPADKAEIEALQQTVSVDVPLEAWPYTEVGESGSISILRGPLAGLTGILVEVRNSQRLILSVNLLRRSVLVEVHSDWVSPYAPVVPERMMA